MADSNIFSNIFGGGNGTLTAAAIIAALGYTPAAAGDPSFYDFMTPSEVLPAGVSFTAASTRWRTNSAGVLVPATTDAPRFQYDPATLVRRGLLIEGAATNAIRNSTMQGAVAGTPGTLPTNWSVGSYAASGLTYAIVGIGSDGGIAYIDVKVSGTAAATSFYDVAKFDGVGAIAAADGQAWIQSNYIKLVGGSLSGLNSSGFRTGYLSYNSGSGFISSVAGTYHTPDANWLRTVNSFTLSGVTIASIVPILSFSVTAGAVIDFTLRVGLPQFVQSSVLSSPIPTTAAAATRAADTARITNPQALADQCYIVKARTASAPPPAGGAQMLFCVDDGTTGNRRGVLRGSDGNIYVSAKVGGTDTCLLNMGSVGNDTDFALAARFADNNFAASLNGGAIVTDLSGATPLGLTAVRIGSDVTGRFWNSTIRTIETRRTATDAELPLLAA